MSGRSRIPLHFPPSGTAGGLHFIDDIPDDGPRRGGVLMPHPPHVRQAAIIEDGIAAQHQEIQVLLLDNQRLAATHVALKQEVAAAQFEMQRLSHFVGREQAEGDGRIREIQLFVSDLMSQHETGSFKIDQVPLYKIYEKSMKMEADLRATDAMRAELIQIRGDIQKLNAARQEFTGEVQKLTQGLSRATADAQQAPAIKDEIEYMKQELQQARQAIEYEKKGYAENYEQGQGMEKNLISMAREVEKLRAEIANAEKRARAAAAAGNQGSAAVSHGASYANRDPSYGVNPYPAAYPMNHVPGTADDGPQFAAGARSAPGHGSWGSYDTQHPHVRR